MPDDDSLKIQVDGEWFEIDDLTLGEAEELEDACGKPIDEIPFSSAKALVYLVWFIKRRKDPKFTLEDARNISISRLGGEEQKEANGNGSPPTKPARKRATAGPRSAGK